MTSTDTVKIISVSGPRLDLNHAPNLRAEVELSLDQGAEALIIDMTQVRFIDSSGLGTLVNVVKRLGARNRLVLMGLSEPAISLLRLSRMDQVLQLEETMDGARQLLARAGRG